VRGVRGTGFGGSAAGVRDSPAGVGGSAGGLGVGVRSMFVALLLSNIHGSVLDLSGA